MPFTRLTKIVDELAGLEIARNRLGQGRSQAMMEAIKPLFANAPHGAIDLTPTFIAYPDASYLIIDTASRARNAMLFDQLTLTIVNLVTACGEILARNAGDDAILGSMNDVATTGFRE